MSSHAVKYRCTHKELEGDSGETTFLIEILEDGFVGSVTDVRGLGDVFRLSYDKIDARNPTENPIQKGRLEFNLAIEDSSDLSILTDFLAADEDQFQMRLKKDGSVLWTGYVLTDLIQYSEGDYPFVGKVVAKDLTRLSGIDFPLTDDRVTLISTISDFLDDLNLGLDIYTYTSWTEQNTDGAVAGDYDFLNRIYNDRKAFRRFARTGDESDEKITLEESLERLLRNYGLILRQEENAWRLYQITALDDPTSVFEAVYNSSGVQQSTSSVDLTVSIDRVNRYLLPASLNEINPGIKRVRNKYDHRTAVSNIAFPELVTLDSGNTSEDQEQLIISDGDQRLALAGDIQADIPTGESNGRVQWRITIVTSSQTYYWDHDNTTWTNTTTINETDLTFVGPGAQTASSDLWIGSLDIETDNLPTDADGTMTVSLLRALSDSSFANETRWENVVFAIKNPVASENSDSIDYQLTQSGGFSTNFEVQDTWFGDGPNAYSPGALRHGSDDGDFTSDDWQRRGTTTGYRNLHENLLKEIIDTQRGPRRNLQADLWGNYSSANVVSYDSKYFFFIGGDLTGRNVWDAQLLEVNIVTGTDTFEDLPKFTDETGSGAGSTGGGSTGGGLDQSTADARYFKQASLLSEVASGDLPTLYGNIGLSDGSADLDLGSLDINGATFVDSSRNVSAGNITSNTGLVVSDGGQFSRFQIIDGASNSWNIISNDTSFGLQLGAGSFIWSINASTEQTTFATKTFHTTIEASGNISVGGWTLRNDGVFFPDVDLGGRIGGDSNRIEDIFTQDATISDTLTINSQLLFTLGNEQLLSTDANPTFNKLNIGASSTTDILIDTDVGKWRNLNNGIWITPDDSTELRIGPSGVGDTFTMLLNRITEFRTTATENLFDNAVAIGTTSLTAGSVLTVGGDADFNGKIYEESFTEGWAGTNWQITEAGDAEVESLRVRGALRVYEFIAKQLSSIGGTEILSIANGRIESVDSGAGTITVDNVDGSANTSFKADDLWIVQVVDVNNDLESGGTGSIVKQVRGSVTSVSGATLTVSVDAGSTDGLADLEQGDLIVAYGSSSDADRQAIMYRNVDRSEDNLIMRLQTGVDAFADLTAEANTAVAYGDLNGYSGLSTETFGFFAGSDSGDHVLIKDDGIFFKNGTDIAAQLSSNLFKIGDNDNYLEFNTSTNVFDLVAGGGDLEINDSEGLVLGYTDFSSPGAVTSTRKIKWNNGTTDKWSISASEVADLGTSPTTTYDGFFLESDSTRFVELRDGQWSDSLDDEQAILFRSDTFYFNGVRSGINSQDISDDTTIRIGHVRDIGFLQLYTRDGYAVFGINNIVSGITVEIGSTTYEGDTISSEPSGTEGTDLKWTVFLRDDGQVYLNNRRGLSRKAIWCIYGDI